MYRKVGLRCVSLAARHGTIKYKRKKTETKDGDAKVSRKKKQGPSSLDGGGLGLGFVLLIDFRSCSMPGTWGVRSPAFVFPFISQEWVLCWPVIMSDTTRQGDLTTELAKNRLRERSRRDREQEASSCSGAP